MRVEKEKTRVSIICSDRSLLVGLVHINPGERLSDFLNDLKEDFIVVTEAEFHNVAPVHSFKMYSDLTKRRKSIILNKAFIKWMEAV